MCAGALKGCLPCSTILPTSHQPKCLLSDCSDRQLWLPLQLTERHLHGADHVRRPCRHADPRFLCSTRCKHWHWMPFYGRLEWRARQLHERYVTSCRCLHICNVCLLFPPFITLKLEHGLCNQRYFLRLCRLSGHQQLDGQQFH